MIDLRHHINHPILGLWGGHMGFSVRPSERQKGYATEMLRLNLENCRKRNMDKVMITCSGDNIASERTIVANGGVFEKEVCVDGEYIKRYWIKLSFERTFDNTVLTYDRVRPLYVKELYEDIFQYKSLSPDSHVLEIGIGTGKATQIILDTGCHFVGIEPGEHLAALALERFQDCPNFSLHNQTLQEYEGPDENFDLIYAATAFHWIPEEYGYKRVYDLLKNGGVFARFAYHAGADKKRKELTAEIQSLYGKYANWSKKTKEYGEEDAKKLAEVALKYDFVDAQYKVYHLTRDFTADEYMELLRTYPDHMALEEKNREKLFEGIYAAIHKNGGIMTVYYTMDLQLVWVYKNK